MQIVDEKLTETIIGCCFDVMNELGVGFLEKVYKNALAHALKEKGLYVESERRFDVYFRDINVGLYIADIVVEKCVAVELKCCDKLIGDHQAQIINYLKAASIPVGLLINFGNSKIDFRRLNHPSTHFYY